MELDVLLADFVGQIWDERNGVVGVEALALVVGWGVCWLAIVLWIVLKWMLRARCRQFDNSRPCSRFRVQRHLWCICACFDVVLEIVLVATDLQVASKWMTCAGC